MSELVHKLFNEHKLVRRVTLFWAVWLITVVVLRVTEPQVLSTLNAATATIVSVVVGLFTSVIGLYQWSRAKEDKNNAA